MQVKRTNRNGNFDGAFHVLKGQSAKIVGSLFIVALFGIFRPIWIDERGSYGLIEYWLKGLKDVPNDYKLLVVVPVICIVFIMMTTATTLVDKNKINPVLLGVLEIVPVLGNLLTMTFFFYLIVYRGLCLSSC